MTRRIGLHRIGAALAAAVLAGAGAPTPSKAPADVPDDVASTAEAAPPIDLPADPGAFTLMDDYVAALQALYAAAGDENGDGDCALILEHTLTYAADPRFAEITDAGRAGLYYNLFRCAYDAADAAATKAALDGYETTGVDPEWTARVRFLAGPDLDDFAMARAGLLALARDYAESLNDIDLRSFWSYLRATKEQEDGDALALEMHDLLDEVGFAPTDPFASLDYLHADYARRLVSLGRYRDARIALRDIARVAVLLEIATDKHFERVRDGLFIDAIDFAAAADAEVEADRALAEAHPGHLEPRYYLINALRQAGRMDEALAEADAALARLADDPKAYADVDDYLNCVHNDRAYTLYDLGRAEEGRAAMRAGLKAGENGEAANVSQVINLAIKLVDEERPAEALDILALMGDASDFGDMYAQSVRACAAAQTGDAAEIERALAFLAEHESDNVSARQRALLCADRADEGADLLIRRLRDRDDRTTALRAVQNWRLGDHEAAYARVLRERFDALKARADVAAAIDEVGRVLDLPLPNAYWGDI